MSEETHIEVKANRFGRRLFWDEKQIAEVHAQGAIDILESIVDEMVLSGNIHISSAELIGIIHLLKES